MRIGFSGYSISTSFGYRENKGRIQEQNKAAEDWNRTTETLGDTFVSERDKKKLEKRERLLNLAKNRVNGRRQNQQESKRKRIVETEEKTREALAKAAHTPEEKKMTRDARRTKSKQSTMVGHSKEVVDRPLKKPRDAQRIEARQLRRAQKAKRSKPKLTEEEILKRRLLRAQCKGPKTPEKLVALEARRSEIARRQSNLAKAPGRVNEPGGFHSSKEHKGKIGMTTTIDPHSGKSYIESIAPVMIDGKLVHLNLDVGLDTIEKLVTKFPVGFFQRMEDGAKERDLIFHIVQNQGKFVVAMTTLDGRACLSGTCGADTLEKRIWRQASMVGMYKPVKTSSDEDVLGYEYD